RGGALRYTFDENICDLSPFAHSSILRCAPSRIPLRNSLGHHCARSKNGDTDLVSRWGDLYKLTLREEKGPRTFSCAPPHAPAASIRTWSHLRDLPPGVAYEVEPARNIGILIEAGAEAFDAAAMWPDTDIADGIKIA